MTPSIPAEQYVSEHYSQDLEAFGSSMMCGIVLGPALAGAVDGRHGHFADFAAFVLCQYELNLLHQAFFTHLPASYWDWREHSLPFADLRECWIGHGMDHRPSSILRFVQDPWGRPDLGRLELSWSRIEEFTRYFLGDYLAGFCSEPVRQELLERIAGDYECDASVRTDSDWEARNASSMVFSRPRERPWS